MKCPKCKKTISEDGKFCEHCGAKLEVETEVSELTNKIIAHLDFLGYEVENLTSIDGIDNFFARHPNKSNLFVKYIKDFGFSVFTFYRMNEEKVGKSRTEFLDLLNTINGTTLMCTYSCDKDNQLIISSWYPSHYEKREFSHFLDSFEADIRRQFNTPGFMDYA